MNRSRIYLPERVLVAVTVLLVLSSGAWTLRQRDTAHRVRVQSGVLTSARAPLGGEELKPLVETTATWSKPVATENGSAPAGLFDPPEKKGEGGRRSPPATVAGATTPEVEFDLLEVRHDPFRLQLVGYLGEPGSYRAVFASPGHAENLLARVGDRFQELGLTLTALSVEKSETPRFQRIAHAVLFDERDGAEVILTDGVVRLTETPVAVLRSHHEKGEIEALHEGQSTSVIAGHTYRIERIQSAPPEIELVDEPGSATPESHFLLHPIEPGGESNNPIQVGEIHSGESATAAALADDDREEASR